MKKNNPFQRATGRGASENVSSRFTAEKREDDFSEIGWIDTDESHLLKTQFLTDHSKSILNKNDSPDIPFQYSLNPYRGCEHGCAYCYARPTHEYLGLSAGLDFESKVFVKYQAASLLRQELLKSAWVPQTISLSGVTDCYQPAERTFKITRSCLEVLAEFANPVGIITKNHLVLRDVDLLSRMASEGLVLVFISITTLDHDLARELEPRTSSPQARLQAIATLSEKGIPVGVNVAPCIPGLTDHEMPKILQAALDRGAQWAGYVPLRLPYSVKDIFAQWLLDHRPDSKNRVLAAVKSLRGGRLNDPQFGSRMRGTGKEAENLKQMFKLFTKKLGLNQEKLSLSTHHFRRPGDQLNLFEAEV